jgi:hypothetical protein
LDQITGISHVISPEGKFGSDESFVTPEANQWLPAALVGAARDSLQGILKKIQKNVITCRD